MTMSYLSKTQIIEKVYKRVKYCHKWSGIYCQKIPYMCPKV